MLDDALAHLQALHVLATDVQDELDIGDECLRTTQVRDRLDFTAVGTERLDEDALTIARRGHMADGHALRQAPVDVIHDLARGTQHVTVVVAVPGVQELAVLAHHRGLHGCRTRIEADEHTAAIVTEVAARDDLLVMTTLEGIVVLVSGKERVKTRDL